jgi:hypothetical protein
MEGFRFLKEDILSSIAKYEIWKLVRTVVYSNNLAPNDLTTIDCLLSHEKFAALYRVEYIPRLDVVLFNAYLQNLSSTKDA